MAAPARLHRRLGLADAVVVGVGSMVGAGVFVVWSPAANAAGTGLLVGLVVAGIVATCNATSSAQLAALHPESGGTYVYARIRLGPTWGRVAGWSFVVGKTASCVAIARVVGAYLWPDQERWVAIVAVVAVAAVNLGGLTRTVAITRVLLAVALLALGLVVVAGWTSGRASLSRLAPIDADPYGILRSAGFLFFAFAGYARIATLGEEVRDPATTIPRAISRALAVVLVLYAVIGVSALATVGPEALASTDAPLRTVLEAGPLDALAPLVRIGAAIAALGVLLNLLPGVSRTVLAMARRGELPRWFAAVHARRAAPLRAELTLTVIVAGLAAFTDLAGAIGVSSVAVLLYYALTNAAALRLSPDERRWPKAVAVVGLVGCVVLAAALPIPAICIGIAATISACLLGRRPTFTPMSSQG